MSAAGPATSVDAFLAGRVEAVQPVAGHHRSGLEAVLLAAALPAATAGTVLDLGAGAGVAGLCAAARCPGIRVVLVEREAELAAAARTSLARPANAAFAGRVSVVEADVAALAGCSGWREAADAVLMNPPFHDAARSRVSPQAGRAGAHVLAPEGLDPWFRAAAAVLKPRGRLVVIFRADGLGDLLAAAGGRFGALDILPVHPRGALPAHRLLLAARKGSRAGLRLLPPLVLHGETGGAFLPPAEAMLRDGLGLDDLRQAWQDR